MPGGAAIPSIPRGVRLQFDRVRDQWVLLAPERTIQLDPTGLAILNEVDGIRSVDQIAGVLAARYDAPLAEITADMTAFLTGLMDRRIIEARE